MDNNTNNVWRLLWTLLHEWFYATFFHLYIIHTIFIFRKDKKSNNNRTNEQGKFEKLTFKKKSFDLRIKNCLKDYFTTINRQTYIYIGYKMNHLGGVLFCVFC
jgi:cbb3-type cytochrome oxidase subunit 3